VQISWIQAIWIALAAYLSVSVWPLGVGYFTLYRPLIAGTIVGLILGDVRQGMAFGAALNAVHLGFVSTGGSLPSDLATAGYIGTALALSSNLTVEAALATFGIPLGVLGGFLWFGRMTLGSIFVHWADARAAKGDVRGVTAINLWAGQGMLFVFYALPTFLVVYLGQRGIDTLLAWLPARLIDALAVVGGLLPAVGIGLLLRSMAKWRQIPYFVVGFLLVLYLDLPILVVGLLGACVAWLAAKQVDQVPRGPSPAVREPVPRVPQRVLRAAWRRWIMFLHASYNYERLQGLGFAHAISPVIEYLYKKREDRAAALKRHTAFFNTEPQFGALVPAVVITMEEERAAGAAISDEAISGVKSGLMGPLAGVGDSLLQGVIVPLLLSLGIGLAQQGNLAGPILYVLLISIVVWGTSYGFWSLGYRLGKAAVSRILSSGWVPVVTEAATVVGLAVVGALAATTVQFSTPAEIVVGPARVSLQTDVLDMILRGVLPLVVVCLVWWLLYKGFSPMRVVGVLFGLGVDMAYLGLAGWSAPALFTAQWRAFVLGGEGATMGSALLHLLPPLLATALVVGVLYRKKDS